MERLEYDEYGGPEVVQLRAFTLGQPKAAEVLVRVAFASVNPMDWKIRKGEMKMFTGSHFPRAMGTDFSGVVEKVGEAVTRFKPGDEVLGTVTMKDSGAFAPMLITAENRLVKKPASVSFAEAASLPIVGVTAWQALVKIAGLTSGQKVFISGAMGGVGMAAVRIAQEMRADVVARVGPQSLAEAQAKGILSVLDYSKPLPDSLRRSFDVVFDCNGGLTIKEGDWLISKGGVVIDIVPSPQKFLKAFFSKSRKVLISDPRAENLQPVVDLAATGKLTIPLKQSVALSDAPSVLAALEHAKGNKGKTVITFPDN